MKSQPADKCKTCPIYSEPGGFCNCLTNTQLDTLMRLSHKAELRRGRAIANKELLHWPIIAITDGVLSLQHLLVDGRKTIAALFMPGDIVDMRGLVHRDRGQIVTLRKTEICRLDLQAFESALGENPNAQKAAWNNLRNQSYRAMDHASDLAKKHALEKLASFVFECRHRLGEQSQRGLIHIPISRTDLADYLGMQPETVSRGFKEFEERDIIAFKDISHLIILNFPTLRRIANGDKRTENLRHRDENYFKTVT